MLVGEVKVWWKKFSKVEEVLGLDWYELGEKVKRKETRENRKEETVVEVECGKVGQEAAGQPEEGDAHQFRKKGGNRANIVPVLAKLRNAFTVKNSHKWKLLKEHISATARPGCALLTEPAHAPAAWKSLAHHPKHHEHNQVEAQVVGYWSQTIVRPNQWRLHQAERCCVLLRRDISDPYHARFSTVAGGRTY